MEDETTYGLPPERVAEILQMGLGDPADRSFEGQVSDRVGDWLDAIVRPDARLAITGAKLDVSPDELKALAGYSVGDLLESERSSAAALVAIKRYAKQAASGQSDPVAHASAVIIYYAAIAAAIVHHDSLITRQDSAAAREGLRGLRDRFRIPADLRDLFFRAMQRLQTGTATLERDLA